MADTFEINREMVLSTAHITKEDADLLTKLLEEHLHLFPGEVPAFVCHVEDSEFGYRFLASLDLEEAGQHLSKHLIGLIRKARELDCKWLLLDRDGPVHDAFPTFDW